MNTWIVAFTTEIIGSLENSRRIVCNNYDKVSCYLEQCLEQEIYFTQVLKEIPVNTVSLHGTFFKFKFHGKVLFYFAPCNTFWFYTTYFGLFYFNLSHIQLFIIITFL